MNNNFLLSVIVPVYNESNRIVNIKKIFKYFYQQKYKTEIIIVDDGSKDDTISKIRKYQKKLKLKVIHYPNNQGKGYAIQQGILISRGDYILFMDIDLSTPLFQFEKFRKYLKDFDVLIGTRKIKDAQLLKRQHILRETLGKGFTLLSQLILGVKVSDFTCGFKCFSKKSAKDVFSRMRIKRWGFDSEVIFIASKQYQIKEIPVVWSNDSKSNVKFPQDIIRSFNELIQIKINEFKGFYN